MPKILAYLRVSTDKGQTTANQRKQIEDAGFKVDEFFAEDGVSGTKPAFERPAFSRMFNDMEHGDTLIVTAVDRLGRTASDVLSTIETITARGIRIRVMQFDGIDITSAMGKMIVTCMSAMAELERNLMVERTKAGLARTKEQGTRLGAPLTIHPSILKEMVDKKAVKSLNDLQTEYGFPRATIGRVISKWGNNLSGYAAEWEVRQAQYAAKEE